MIDFDKVKAHVGRHKVAYTAGTVVVVAGVSFYIGVRLGSARISLDNSATLVGINSKLNHTVNVLVERPGPPSWMIRCIETGEEFLSQRSAAFAHGISPVDLSSHLNGYLENVNGKHYVRTGLAAA